MTRFDEPPNLVELDDWFDFPPAMFRYLQRIVHMFANHAAVGVERLGERHFRVWRFEVRQGRKLYIEVTELGPTLTGALSSGTSTDGRTT